MIGLLLALSMDWGAGLCSASTISLVEYDELWSYCKGTNPPQANWRTLPDSSLDASWTNGMGGFGYADNTGETALCQTLLSDMQGRYTTFYMRKQFLVVSPVDTNLHLMLAMDWDDGFMVWLDGNYLTNAFVTGAPNVPSHTATASGGHESSRGNSSPKAAVTYDLGSVGARLSEGTHVLAIVGLNQTIDSTDFIQITSLYLAPAPLVSHEETWRYRKGTNAPQSDWKTIADASLDGTWSSGAGGFGYADNTAETALCQTTMSGMRSNYTTLYMRRQFTPSSDLNTNLHLFLTMDWDDGFIAWLDGEYLVSDFVAGAPAEPAYNARATADHESSRGGSSGLPPTTYDLGPVGTRLAAGIHTLAIMGLNDSITSSDFIQIADLAVGEAPPTQPPVTNFPPGWRFIFFGDSRGNSSSSPVNTQILNEIARAATNERPAFILFSGDLVYSGNLGLPAYQLWTNAMSPVYRAGIRVYPILGNHDAQGIGIATFTNLFGPSLPANGPEGEVFRTYSVVHSNALILALDNYIGEQGTVNQAWIDAVLATNHLPHIFSYGHVAAFQVTTDHRSIAEYTTAALRDAFWTSLRNAGAKMYICGHYHFYDHAWIDDGDGESLNDMHQFVLGAGGAPPMTTPPDYPGTNAPWLPRNVYHDYDYGYGLVNVDGATVTVTWKNRVAPGNFQPGGDVFTYHSPRAPVLRIADNGGNSLLLRAGNLVPGTTNVVEERPSATLGSWQVTAQFVSPSNSYELMCPRTNTSSFFRLRTR